MTVGIQRKSTTVWKSGWFSSLCLIHRHFSETSIYWRRTWKMHWIIVYPVHSSSSKRNPQLHPWHFEEDLQLLKLVETSLLEWLHLWKWSPTAQETISYLLSRLWSCWFNSKRDGRNYVNSDSAKNPPPKQSNSPAPKPHDTVYPQFNTSWQRRQLTLPLLIYQVASCW